MEFKKMRNFNKKSRKYKKLISITAKNHMRKNGLKLTDAITTVHLGTMPIIEFLMKGYRISKKLL